MYACELVEFAGLLTTNAPLIVRHTDRLSDSGLEQYWTASKCRQEHWSRALKNFSQNVQYAKRDDVAGHWMEIRPILEEILITEVLTRVWTAICCGCEQRTNLEQASPVVRNIFSGHLESRNRALNLMVYGHGLRVDEAVMLNRIRRRNERWTDVLMGCLAGSIDIGEFAFSASRAHEFAADSHDSASPDASQSLLLASLRASYRHSAAASLLNDKFNHDIVAGILACLPGELFDATGKFKSLWLARMQHAARDTEGMIDELIALDETAENASESFAIRSGLPRTRGRR